MPSLLEADRVLAEALAALGNPTRLAILRELIHPKALNHIRVPAEDDAAVEGGGAARHLSRQAVRQHLDRLVEVATVRALASEDGRVGAEYVVDPTRIYAIAEELRDLAALRPDELAEGATRQFASGMAGRSITGPRFLLARGLREGSVFALRREERARVPAAGPERATWVIGRRRGVDVCLDYDPYVSAENALVAFDGSAFTVQDVPGSRNGTTLNFVPLPKDGAPQRLAHGDLVSVGRSVLSFRER